VYRPMPNSASAFPGSYSCSYAIRKPCVCFFVNELISRVRVNITYITYSFIANCQTAVVHKNKTKRRSKIYKSQYIFRYNIILPVQWKRLQLNRAGKISAGGVNVQGRCVQGEMSDTRTGQRKMEPDRRR